MKPKVAFFDFAGCEGDQLQVANLEEALLDLLSHVEVVRFREVMKGGTDDYDIAFIEGSITRPQDEERLKKIRKNASIVVALGSCATIGGINALKNHMDSDEVRRTVYGVNADLFDTYDARPIDAVVKVDAYIHGCPINTTEFVEVVQALLMGKTPKVPNYPVCVECKRNENICAFERKYSCMGPITRGGCNATCINEGAKCWGCRGMVDNPNKDSEKEIMEKYGLTVEDVKKFFNMYSGWQEGSQ